MLSNNKLFTYALYAIGEIGLVVIGILIAVQIDAWNETRKEQKLEIEILKNLREDIAHNLIRIKSVYTNDSINRINNLSLLRLLHDPGSEYHDSLRVYFGGMSRYDVFTPRRMAYEALKSRGLELIKNEILRSEIIKLYDEVYALNPMILEIRKDIHINSVMLFNKSFLTLADVEMKVPNDFESLKSNTEFMNHLSYIAAESGNFLTHYQTLYSVTESVESNIGIELKNLSK